MQTKYKISNNGLEFNIETDFIFQSESDKNLFEEGLGYFMEYFLMSDDNDIKEV